MAVQITLCCPKCIKIVLFYCLVMHHEYCCMHQGGGRNTHYLETRRIFQEMWDVWYWNVLHVKCCFRTAAFQSAHMFTWCKNQCNCVADIHAVCGDWAHCLHRIWSWCGQACCHSRCYWPEPSMPSTLLCIDVMLLTADIMLIGWVGFIIAMLYYVSEFYTWGMLYMNGAKLWHYSVFLDWKFIVFKCNTVNLFGTDFHRTKNVGNVADYVCLVTCDVASQTVFQIFFSSIEYRFLFRLLFDSRVHCVQKKRDQNVFCNISHKTRAILMKFGMLFPE